MDPQFENIIHRFIDEAFEVNKNSKSCHVAFLLKGRHKVVSYGFNQMDRQFYKGKMTNSLHAEIDCLRKTRNVRKYTLVVVKIAKTNTRKYYNSMPCKQCTDYLIDSGFKRIYCSNDQGQIVKIVLNNYTPYNLTN